MPQSMAAKPAARSTYFRYFSANTFILLIYQQSAQNSTSCRIRSIIHFLWHFAVYHAKILNMISMLIQKIISMFLMIAVGFVLVRAGLLKAKDNKVLANAFVYVFSPCALINAFQIEYSEETRNGFLLALAAAVILHALMILITTVMKKILKLDPVETTSIIYSNSSNFIIPLIVAMLGQEWTIYASPFIAVQMVLFWTHCKAELCGERSINWKQILLNTNMIAIFIGIPCFFLGLRFPWPLQNAIESFGDMLGPTAMLVVGMIIGGMKLKELLAYRRVWLVSFLKLVLVPLVMLVFLRFSGIANVMDGGKEILYISFLAVMSPTASFITQLSILFGQDDRYAGVLNLVTTLLCIITMPLLSMLYFM